MVCLFAPQLSVILNAPAHGGMARLSYIIHTETVNWSQAVTVPIPIPVLTYKAKLLSVRSTGVVRNPQRNNGGAQVDCWYLVHKLAVPLSQSPHTVQILGPKDTRVSLERTRSTADKRFGENQCKNAGANHVVHKVTAPNIKLFRKIIKMSWILEKNNLLQNVPNLKMLKDCLWMY